MHADPGGSAARAARAAAAAFVLFAALSCGKQKGQTGGPSGSLDATPAGSTPALEALSAPPEVSSSPPASSVAAPASPAQASGSPSASAAPAGSSGQAAGGPDVAVRLLEPGNKPRRALRYKFRASQAETVTIETRMAVATHVGDAAQAADASPPEAESPPVRMTIKIEPKRVDKSGDVAYRLELVSAEALRDGGVAPETAAVVHAQLQAAVGLTGSTVVDARGQTREAQLSARTGLDPYTQALVDNLKQSLRHLASPMPEEPIGVGARWELTIPIETPAMRLTQISTHTLRSLAGDRGRVEIYLVQEAPRQPLRGPHMPPGSVTVLESFASKGDGTLDFDLTRIVPTSSLNVASTLGTRIEQLGEPQRVKTTIRARVQTRGK